LSLRLSLNRAHCPCQREREAADIVRNCPRDTRDGIGGQRDFLREALQPDVSAWVEPRACSAFAVTSSSMLNRRPVLRPNATVSHVNSGLKNRCLPSRVSGWRSSVFVKRRTWLMTPARGPDFGRRTREVRFTEKGPLCIARTLRRAVEDPTSGRPHGRPPKCRSYCGCSGVIRSAFHPPRSWSNSASAPS